MWSNGQVSPSRAEPTPRLPQRPVDSIVKTLEGKSWPKRLVWPLPQNPQGALYHRNKLRMPRRQERGSLMLPLAESRGEKAGTGCDGGSGGEGEEGRSSFSRNQALGSLLGPPRTLQESPKQRSTLDAVYLVLNLSHG